MQIPSISQEAFSNTGPTASRQQSVELQHNAIAGDAAVQPDLSEAVKAAGEKQQAKDSNAWEAQQAALTKQLQASISELNNVATLYNNELEFSVNEDNGQPVVKVVDKESNKVIRQIPSEEAIRIAKAIRDFSRGLLLQETA